MVRRKVGMYTNPLVNKVVYHEIKSDLTPSDWLSLAIACLDQAGYSAEAQIEVMRLLIRHGGRAK